MGEPEQKRVRGRFTGAVEAAWMLLVSVASAILLLGGCGGDDTQSTASRAADISSTPPKVVVSETTPSTKADEGWFVRTVAPLGDERGLCIKLWGWTPTNIKFDVPVISHTCKHGWWNMEGRFDRGALDRGRLEMPFFKRCLEADSSDSGASLFAKPCEEGPLQRFSFVETGHIVLASNPELCMSVPDEPHRDAGGDNFWMNGLILEACSEQGTERQLWTFTEPL